MEEEYIKQCEMAGEVQEWWKQTENNHCTKNRNFGDSFYNSAYDYEGLLLYEAHAGVFKFVRHRDIATQAVDHLEMSFLLLIWLPHQHQLQEMLIADGDNSITRYTELLARFIGWHEFNGWYEATIDQLWLAYFMHKKYSKRWNGKDWELIPPA